MQTPRYTRADDLAEINTEVMDLESLFGKWFNHDRETGHIDHLFLEKEGGDIYIRPFGADEPEPVEWGRAKITFYRSGIDSPEITGLTTFFDFGFMETRIAGNFKKGVMVIQTYNIFKDNSGRPNYFSREFFHQRK